MLSVTLVSLSSGQILLLVLLRSPLRPAFSRTFPDSENRQRTNIIGKVANGIANEIVGTTASAATCPVVSVRNQE
jgi:hypothetical protein